MLSGIYNIINLINGKRYIGSAFNFNTRKNTHFRELLKNIHKNSHLQAAYNLYKKDNFVFEIIEECKLEDLDDRERYWIHFYPPEELYNICYENPTNPTKGNGENAIKARIKISNSRKGIKLPPFTEEHKRKIGDSKRGKKRKPFPRHKLTEETKKKISEANKGRVGGPYMLGKYHTEETKERLRNNNTKSVQQIDLQIGITINSFRSIREASRITNIERASIGKCCQGILKSAGGYYWKYIESLP